MQGMFDEETEEWASRVPSKAMTRNGEALVIPIWSVYNVYIYENIAIFHYIAIKHSYSFLIFKVKEMGMNLISSSHTSATCVKLSLLKLCKYKLLI